MPCLAFEPSPAAVGLSYALCGLADVLCQLAEMHCRPLDGCPFVRRFLSPKAHLRPSGAELALVPEDQPPERYSPCRTLRFLVVPGCLVGFEWVLASCLSAIIDQYLMTGSWLRQANLRTWGYMAVATCFQMIATSTSILVYYASLTGIEVEDFRHMLKMLVTVTFLCEAPALFLVCVKPAIPGHWRYLLGSMCDVAGYFLLSKVLNSPLHSPPLEAYKTPRLTPEDNVSGPDAGMPPA